MGGIFRFPMGLGTKVLSINISLLSVSLVYVYVCYYPKILVYGSLFPDEKNSLDLIPNWSKACESIKFTFISVIPCLVFT